MNPELIVENSKQAKNEDRFYFYSVNKVMEN